MSILKSCDGSHFIIKISDIVMIKSYGQKTLFLVKGIERPLIADYTFAQVESMIDAYNSIDIKFIK